MQDNCLERVGGSFGTTASFSMTGWPGRDNILHRRLYGTSTLLCFPQFFKMHLMQTPPDNRGMLYFVISDHCRTALHGCYQGMSLERFL